MNTRAIKRNRSPGGTPEKKIDSSALMRSRMKILSLYSQPQEHTDVILTHTCRPDIISSNNTRKQYEQWCDREVEQYNESDEEEEFIPPPKKKLPSENCICKQSWCRETCRIQRDRLNQPVLSKKISCQAFRDAALEPLNLSKRIETPRAWIKITHFPIEKRHVVHQKQEKQFTDDSLHFVLPTQTKADVMKELELSVELQTLNNDMFVEKVLPHIKGYGDGSFSLKDLEELCEKARRPEIHLINLDASIKEVMEEVKQDGSRLIDSIIARVLSIQKKGVLRIPENIPENEYLYSYNQHMLGFHVDMEPVVPPFISANCPASLFSRRKKNRPAYRNSKSDICLKTPTDVDSLMYYLLPMNEPCMSSGKNKKYIDQHLVVGEMEWLKVHSQGEFIENYPLLPCFDRTLNQKIYVDVTGNLPSLTNNKRCSWKHGHYYLLGEVLTRQEIKSTVEIFTEINMDYLPVALLCRCRFKGAMFKESKKEENIQLCLDQVADRCDVQMAKKEFEEFFNHLLQAFIINLNGIDHSDLGRLNWASWNYFNTKWEDHFAIASQEVRKLTRDTAITSSEEFCIYHNYLTILQHSQGARDLDTQRLHAQLTTHIPTNDEALNLFRQHDPYELYFLMSCNIFGKYGMGSIRAESEIHKMIMLKLIMTEEQRLPTTEESKAMYQIGPKKVHIVENEMMRHRHSIFKNCTATGADRHVYNLLRLFNPMRDTKRGLELFTRLLCQSCADHILWNLNEITGYIAQCFSSQSSHKSKDFAVSVLKTLFREHDGRYDFVKRLYQLSKQQLQMLKEH